MGRERQYVQLTAAGRYGAGNGLVVMTDRRLLSVMDGRTIFAPGNKRHTHGQSRRHRR